VVAEFRGKWAKLGNFAPCIIVYRGHAYNSVEHAYQAHKSLDPEVQAMIRNQPTPNAAKKLARRVVLRPDWEQVKVQIMRDLLVEKFSQEPERSILLATGDEELVEGNWWHDTFWGQCPVGHGENMLGKLLMELREAIRKEA
jgi:ribA/ribD-fused uncharacterized protein